MGPTAELLTSCGRESLANVQIVAFSGVVDGLEALALCVHLSEIRGFVHLGWWLAPGTRSLLLYLNEESVKEVLGEKVPF